MRSLERVQNAATRIIVLQALRLTTTLDNFSTLHWLTITHKIKYEIPNLFSSRCETTSLPSSTFKSLHTFKSIAIS